MRNANELLGEILVTLNSINNKVSAQPGGGGEKKGGTRTTITGAIASFGKKDSVEGGKGFTNFAKNIADVSKTASPKKIDSLTKSLTGLFDVIKSIGRNSKTMYRGLDIMDRLAMSLRNIAAPLNSMAFFLLKVGVSIVAFAGSLLIASKMLGGKDPLEGIQIVGKIILGMVILMAILGAAGEVVKRGGDTIASMGRALLWLALGLVAFVSALVIIPKILNYAPDGDGIMQSLLVIGGVIAGSALLFAGMGFLEKSGGLISKGTGAAAMMALGMVLLAGAVIIVAAAARAISAIGAMDETTKEQERTILGIPVSPMVYGLGTMGTVILGAIGLFALLGAGATTLVVLAGAGTALVVALAMIALAHAVKEVVRIAKTLDGEDIAGNISMLVGGVFMGLSEGVSKGLLGEDSGSDKPWWQKIGTAAKATAKIMTGIALLTSVSFALSQFAHTLAAFEKLGQIIPIESYDSNGKPVFGKRVTVTQISENIATTISTFFSTLSTLFGENGTAKVDKEAMNDVLVTLMGTGGFSVFGVPVLRTGPNLMDALYSFADVLTYWGKFGEKNEIPGGTDSQGNPIKPVKVVTVAKNITAAIGAFMHGLSDGILTLDKKLAEKSAMVAYALLGKKNTGLLGWLGNITGITRDRPGILEPVSKFGEIIQQFASGQYIAGYDKTTGEPIYKSIDYKATALSIVDAVKSFTVSLSDGFAGMKGGVNYGDKAKEAGEFLEDFEGLFSGLEKLANAQSGLDKLANSLMGVGEGIGLIAENLNGLDTAKLNRVATSAENYEEGSSSRTSRGRRGSSPDWDDISDMIGEKVGERVNAALQGGQFRFEFSDPTGGVFSIEPD